MKLNEMKASQRRLSLFTGEPGTGKSWQAASYVKAGKTLILDLDQRANSLKKLAAAHPWINEIEVEQIGPGDFIKFKSMLDQLQMMCTYDVVIIDGLTAASRLLMNYMMEIRGTSSKERTNPFKKKGVLDLPEIEDFGGEALGS